MQGWQGRTGGRDKGWLGDLAVQLKTAGDGRGEAEARGWLSGVQGEVQGRGMEWLTEGERFVIENEGGGPFL